MAATREDILGWLLDGKKAGATHMIVVCDTYDWEDYPVYVKPEQQVKQVFEQFNGKNMQRVMEVYNLALDFTMQIHENRAWHL